MNTSIFRGYFLFADVYSKVMKRTERGVMKFKTKEARRKWVETNQDKNPVYASAHQANKLLRF